jgi:NADH dehydrogenase (ubiquinone) 1 alpha subcomplex subunit 9
LALLPFSPKDDKSIHDSVKRSNVVINLIGKDNATHNLTGDVNYSLEDTLVNVPRKVARIAKKAGVSSFIHVSALAANPNSSSEWSRMKALGEQAVREEFPDAIIVRPATMFGHEDKFLNRVALALEHAPFIPMINNGINKVQPVNVGDVSSAIHLILMVRPLPLQCLSRLIFALPLSSRIVTS